MTEVLGIKNTGKHCQEYIIFIQATEENSERINGIITMVIDYVVFLKDKCSELFGEVSMYLFQCETFMAISLETSLCVPRQMVSGRNFFFPLVQRTSDMPDSTGP